AATRVIVDLGLGGRLVGVAEHDAAAPEIDADGSPMPIVGNFMEVDTERLLTLSPTHVVFPETGSGVPEDLRALAQRFAAGQPLTDEAMDLVERYRWPGNVRELRNVMTRARLLADGGPIAVQLLEPQLPVACSDLHLKTRVRAFERELFTEALRRCNGRKADASRLLGIDPSNWAYHAKRLGLV
ncbi:MAG: helix-turn-helix domain-containing protein, partial [Planctomycetota bacterium]